MAEKITMNVTKRGKPTYDISKTNFLKIQKLLKADALVIGGYKDAPHGEQDLVYMSRGISIDMLIRMVENTVSQMLEIAPRKHKDRVKARVISSIIYL